MERIDKICGHFLWESSMKEIQRLEEDRIFCRHDYVHFLDVARIAYIENLEKGLHIPKDWIYAAAFLHDIGRHKQYLEGISHDEASVILAKEILGDCGFETDEQEEILKAISSHRRKETAQEESFSGMLYRADKKSRNCLLCPACSACNWDEEKKNMSINV